MLAAMFAQGTGQDCPLFRATAELRKEPGHARAETMLAD
jgi:hypothetical protein